MRLVERFRRQQQQQGAALGIRERGSFGPYSWPTQHPGFSFNGMGYGPQLIQSMPASKVEEFAGDFAGHVRAALESPPVFGAQNKRARYLSQARFTYRNRATRRTFGASSLSILERPWVNGTSGELITKMEWHAGLAGNAYAARILVGSRPTIKLLNPGWVTIILGSEQDPDDAVNQLDAEVVGYAYTPGGLGSGKRPIILLPQDVAHWSPLPDPNAAFRGMSWVTPALREVQGDIAASEHKLRFFENGATPNLVVSGIPATSKDEFDDLVEMMDSNHAGVANAYKTLYLAAGADATVVGSDLKQIDFKATQGAGETRIALLSEVPASLLGISEGMQGSSLNAGNYAEARRSFIDGWLTSSLQSLVACLGQIVPVPNDSELWFDTADMPIVREDASDAAKIKQTEATTIGGLVREGFTPDSAVAAVIGQDMSLLQHTNKLSVQLQDMDSDGARNLDATDLATLVQKVYLGVANNVISAEEARTFLAEAGFPVSGPPPIPALPPGTTGEAPNAA